VTQSHPWDVSPAEARAIQDRLRGQLRMTDAECLKSIWRVAGVDNTYRRHDGEDTAYAVVLLLSFPELEVLETSSASAPVTFPYVPGLLAFREAPAVLAAFRDLRLEPDVILFDAHGYAHPRRIGLASHLGVILCRNLPG
jgi:deoxyribonuclease V